MKHLIIALILALSASTTYANTDHPVLISKLKAEILNNNQECISVIDVEALNFSRIRYYNIICDNEHNGVTIYQVVPKRTTLLYTIQP